MGVSIERTGAAVQVTLGWTHKRNSLAPDDAAELAAAIERAGADPDAAALIVTGDGAFCSGGDLRTFSMLSRQHEPDEMAEVVYGKIHAVVRALRDTPLATIAAIDGAAIGLGMDFALACDMRFVGPDGWLQQGWSRVGLITAAAGGHFLAHHNTLLPWELMLSQERLDSAACASRGLAWPAPTSALASAAEAAGTLATIPAQTRAAYVTLHRRAVWPTDDYLRVCARAQARLLTSAAFRDRADAILASR